LAKGKTELETLIEVMDEEKKTSDFEEQKLKKKNNLVKDEVRQQMRAKEKIEAETVEETADAKAEEARLLKEMRSFRQRASAAQVVRDENIGKIKEMEGGDFDVESLLQQAPTVDMTNALRYYVTPPDSPVNDALEGDAGREDDALGGGGHCEGHVDVDVVVEGGGEVGGGGGAQIEKTASFESATSRTSSMKGKPDTKVFRK
jgi:hypothetical protein